MFKAGYRVTGTWNFHDGDVFGRIGESLLSHVRSWCESLKAKDIVSLSNIGSLIEHHTDSQLVSGDEISTLQERNTPGSSLS